MMAVLLVALVVVTSGGLLARGATEAFLSRLVEGYFGEENNFDLLVQIQAEEAETGRQALAELLARELPGTRIKVGPSLGGQQNYFISLPKERKTARDLGRLDALLSRLAGFSGYTVLMHPVVTVSRVHPAFRSELREAVGSLTGVQLSFWHGDDLVLLLDNPEESQAVAARLEQFLKLNQVYRLELPVPLSAREQVQLVSGVAERLNEAESGGSAGNRYRALNSAGSQAEAGLNLGAEAGDLQQALQAASELLQLYVTRVEVRFREVTRFAPGDQVLLVPSIQAGEAGVEGQAAAVVAQVTEIGSDGMSGRALVISGQWDGGETARVFAWQDGGAGAEIGTATVDSPRLQLIGALTQAERLLASAQSNGQELPQVLDDLDAAISGVERLLDRVDILFHSSSAAQKDQLLVTLALRVLGEQLGLSEGGSQGGVQSSNQAEAGGGLGGDMAGLDRESLVRLRKGIEKLRAQSQLTDDSQLASTLADLQGLGASLRRLNDGQLGAGLLTLQQYLQVSNVVGNRLEWRGPAGLSEDRLRRAIDAELAATGEVLPAHARISNLPAGIIQPDARTQLLTVVRSAGRLVNILFIGMLTLLVLLFDQATVIATWKGVYRAKRRLVRASRGRERLAAFLLWTGDRLAPSIYGAGAGALLAGGGSLLSLILTGTGGAGTGAVAPAGVTANLGAIQIPLVIGAFLGLLVALAAERLSPVAEEQVLAGESLGLSYRQIMEEIVIPAGRPGLYQLLLAARRDLLARGWRDRQAWGPAWERPSLREVGAAGSSGRSGGASRGNNDGKEGEAWQVSW